MDNLAQENHSFCTRALSLLHNRMWQSRNSEVHVHLVQHCLHMTWIVMVYIRLHRSITKCFVSNVESCAVMTRTCFATIWHIFSVCFDTGLNRSVMCQFNVETLTVIRWTCLGFTRFDNGLPQSTRRDSLFVKRIYIDLLGTGRFFFHFARFSCELRQRVAPICHDLRLELVCLIGNFLHCCTTCRSGRWACSEPNSLFQSCLKEIFGGGRGDMYSFSYLASPVSILTTFGTQQAESVSWRMIAFDRVW